MGTGTDGTSATTAGGAFRPGAGSMHPGYPDPGPLPVVRRHLRLFLWIVGAFMVLFGVGLPLLVRPLLADEDGFRLPAGLALVQFLIAAAIVVAGVVLWLGGLRRTVVPRPAPDPAELPGPVRKAIRRREEVPERYRAHIPVWLDQLRNLGWMLTGQAVWMFGFGLAQSADGGSWGHVLFWFGVFVALYLVFFGVPLALFRRWLTRTRRHYAAGNARGAP